MHLYKPVAGNVGLAFKKHVKDGRIHIFHIIPLYYSVLKRCEGVKDATGILFLMWIDRPVKGVETIPCWLFFILWLPKSIVTLLKLMFSALKLIVMELKSMMKYRMVSFGLCSLCFFTSQKKLFLQLWKIVWTIRGKWGKWYIKKRVRITRTLFFIITKNRIIHQYEAWSKDYP